MTIRCLSIEICARCNIRCRHCAPACAPQPSQQIDINLLREGIRAAAGLGVPVVSATGGEPFLYPGLVEQFAAIASEYGLQWRVVTNGSWGAHHRIDPTLDRLSRHPGGSIALSIDRFHAEFVELEHTLAAASKARERGLGVELNLLLDRHPNTLEVVRKVSAWGLPVSIATVMALGRAADLPAEDLFDTMEIGGCNTVDTAYLRADGRVLRCCGAPDPLVVDESALALGNAQNESIQAILTRHADAFSDRLRTFGPAFLYSALQSEGGALSAELQTHQPSYCASCAAIAARPAAVAWVCAADLTRFRHRDRLPIARPLLDDSFQLCDGAEFLPIVMHVASRAGTTEQRSAILVTFLHEHKREYVLLDSATATLVQHAELQRSNTKQSGSDNVRLPSLASVRQGLILRSLVDRGLLLEVDPR